MSWNFAYASRAGGEKPCSDVCVCEALGDYLIAAVADGAGSAEKGREGAAIACGVFMELAVPLFSGSMEPSCLVAAIQDRIPCAEEVEHSCTLVAAVAGPAGALFLQVGDGAAVFAAGGESRSVGTASRTTYEVALWPEETEFLNFTYFVTGSDAAEHLQVRRVDGPVDQIALFTDGLQHLVLDLKTKSPHQPFFDSVFERLAASEGHDNKASWWLERTLASESVTKRTDDDTSIVVARNMRAKVRDRC